MQQAGDAAAACTWRGRWPGPQIHAQRHPLRVDAERRQRLEDGRAGRGDAVGQAQDHRFAQPPAPTLPAAVADAMQCDEFATGDMHHA